MPSRPPNNCEYPGCSALASGSKYCSNHRSIRPSKVEAKKRINPYSAMYGRRWRRARKQFLFNNPLCVDCKKEDVINSATEVDHIQGHKGDHELFWNEGNWQGLCKSHHSRKTVKEDGGFGRG